MDEEPDDVGLFRGEQFVPDGVDVLQGLNGIDFLDLGLQSRNLPNCLRQHLGRAQHVPQFLNNHGLNLART